MSGITHLFEPIKVGGVELKNRMMMLALTTFYGNQGKVSERYKDFYAERAKGGVGLISVGILYPSDIGPASYGGLSIAHDQSIPGLRELTHMIHTHGAKAAGQLGLQYKWRGGEVVGPSQIVTRRDLAPPRPLTVQEIHQIVDEFGDGAKRARQAGFDFIELHAGIGYFINRFLSPLTNKRTDAYGGSADNRMRLLLEIIDSAKNKAGHDYPLICRISGDEFMQGGNALEESKQISRRLEDAGVQCISVQAGWHEAPVPLIHQSVPPGAYVYQAEEIKGAVNVPVVAAYRINDPLLADKILAKGEADLIGLARALIADPEFPAKAREGRLDEIRRCIACCHCLDLVLSDKPMACTVNAMAGREAEYIIRPASRPKRVFVIGGGPAGMEAASRAAQRGHQVTLWERRNELGGQLLLAAIPPFKAELANLRKYLIGQVERCGVRIKMGVEATASSLQEERPDAVIVATGADPITPEIPGVERENVVTAFDVLSGCADAGQNVIVLGGGMVGCETAELLASKGKKVTILEMLGRIGNDIGMTTRWVIIQRLREAGIKMETEAKASEITDKGVRVVRRGSSEFFDGDTVVLAVGVSSNKKLAQELEGMFADIHTIGDCVEPGRFGQAIEGGLRVAREL